MYEIQEYRPGDEKTAIALLIVFVGEVAKENKYEVHVKANIQAFAAFCQPLGLEEKGILDEPVQEEEIAEDDLNFDLM